MPPKKKAKKDPNAPKRPSSSYLFYVNANRAKVKEENPDMAFGDIVSVRRAFDTFASIF